MSYTEISILLRNFYISTDDDTNNLTIYHSAQRESILNSSVYFILRYSIYILRIFTNSLRFHEIAIQIVYFSDPGAITYPLILQYCQYHTARTYDNTVSICLFRFNTSARHFCICLESAVADIGNLRGNSCSHSFLSWNYSPFRSSRSLHFAKRNSHEKQQECDRKIQIAI